MSLKCEKQTWSFKFKKSLSAKVKSLIDFIEMLIISSTITLIRRDSHLKTIENKILASLKKI